MACAAGDAPGTFIVVKFAVLNIRTRHTLATIAKVFAVSKGAIRGCTCLWFALLIVAGACTDMVCRITLLAFRTIRVPSSFAAVVCTDIRGPGVVVVIKTVES